MRLAQILTILATIAVLAVPWLMRRNAPQAPPPEDARKLIVVTPHVQQITDEFEIAFDRWHTERHGQRIVLDVRRPGGTSEIIEQLRAQYSSAVKNGHYRSENGDIIIEPGAIGFDLMFGGGSYDHGRLKDGLTVTVDGEALFVRMSASAGLDQVTLDEWYGENAVGAGILYDPEQYWLGTALSSFGIVYNRRLFEAMGLPEPTSFPDLTASALANKLALADPRQSGSITTTFDSILNHYGWDEGWRILRDLSANTKYFTASSTKPPMDVSAGEAAAGLAIDFYGRGQAQVVMRPGETPETSRVGYADPEGAVFVDADPVSLLNGAPDRELAERFIEFCLTEQGQALWQFEPNGGDGTLGPVRHSLRRMPVRRLMYERHFERFTDRVNPFELAGTSPYRGWRSSIGVMMGAFGIESLRELHEARDALYAARADADFPPELLAELERAFYAMPEHVMPDGTTIPFTEETYRDVRGSWRTSAMYQSRCEIAYARFFRDQYRTVVRLAQSAGEARAHVPTSH